MEPNKIYKIEREPSLLQALIDDLDEFLAESSAAGRLIHKLNDRAFDLRKKLTSIQKSNDQTSTNSKTRAVN